MQQMVQNSRVTAAKKERTVREEGGRASATEKAVAFKRWHTRDDSMNAEAHVVHRGNDAVQHNVRFPRSQEGLREK